MPAKRQNGSGEDVNLAYVKMAGIHTCKNTPVSMLHLAEDAGTVLRLAWDWCRWPNDRRKATNELTSTPFGALALTPPPLRRFRRPFPRRQWLCYAQTSEQVAKTRLLRFFSSLYATLKRGSRAALQFYPDSTEQAVLISSCAARQDGVVGVHVATGSILCSC